MQHGILSCIAIIKDLVYIFPSHLYTCKFNFMSLLPGTT